MYHTGQQVLHHPYSLPLSHPTQRTASRNLFFDGYAAFGPEEGGWRRPRRNSSTSSSHKRQQHDDHDEDTLPFDPAAAPYPGPLAVADRGIDGPAAARRGLPTTPTTTILRFTSSTKPRHNDFCGGPHPQTQRPALRSHTAALPRRRGQPRRGGSSPLLLLPLSFQHQQLQRQRQQRRPPAPPRKKWRGPLSPRGETRRAEGARGF